MNNQQYVLFIGNDNILEINGIRNAVNSIFINNASVSATLKNMAGQDVVGQVWPVSVPYTTASQGCYRALLPNTLVLTNGHHYKLDISIISRGLKASYSVIISAQVRRNQ